MGNTAMSSRDVNRINGSIVDFRPGSWLLQDESGDLHRLSVGTAIEAVGTFRRGDPVEAHLTPTGQLLVLRHTGTGVEPTFSRRRDETSWKVAPSPHATHVRTVERPPHPPHIV